MSILILLPIATFIISFVIVAYMLPRILLLSLRKRLFDPIDPRKIHSVPASRLGGVAFLPAIFFAVWSSMIVAYEYIPSKGPDITLTITLTYLSLALLTLFLIGIYDDVLGVTYKKKFIAQIFAASLLICSGTYFRTLNGAFGIEDIPVYIGIPLTLFFLVFVTNAINLIDGIDGLASMLAMCALSVYSIILYMHGYIVETLITAAAFGALAPFWYSNVFGVKRGIHSKIFMGDTGALVIGAVLAYSAVTIWNMSHFNAISLRYSIIAYTMLLVPCFDVIRIIIHRFLDHKPLFLPDKNHIHHKFMAIGATPRQALFCIILMNITFLALNVLLSKTFELNITVIAIADIITWTIIHLALSRMIKRTLKSCSSQQ